HLRIVPPWRSDRRDLGARLDHLGRETATYGHVRWGAFDEVDRLGAAVRARVGQRHRHVGILEAQRGHHTFKRNLLLEIVNSERMVAKRGKGYGYRQSTCKCSDIT